MANNNAATQAQKAPPEAGAPVTQNATPIAEGHWQEYWEGQRKINGLLFEVDMKLITAILELKKVVDSELNFNNAIQIAKRYAEQVPAVNPPGCEPPGGGSYGGGGYTGGDSGGGG